MTRPIPFGKSVKRPPSGFVTVKEASDAPVAVQQSRRLLHVGDRVQHKAVSVTGYAKRHGREKVHEALEHEALVSRDIFRPYQRYGFRRDAPLEISASDFISTSHIQESRQRNTVFHAHRSSGGSSGGMRFRKGCPVPLNTPSAVSGAAERPPHPQRQVRSASGETRLFPSGNRHIGGFRYELRLLHEVIALQKLPGKREDVTALAQTEVVPKLFRHVHTERGVRSPLYGARYHSSLPLLLTGSCPSRARKSASGILLIASISVRSMPVSVDDELDADPELRVELPRVATPQATLPQVGKQGDTVCHVTLHIERQRTAVDEGVPVVQRGAVMQTFFPQFTDSYPARAEAPA